MIPTLGSVGKFLHRGSVDRVLHHGSIENCAYPLLSIDHYNESFAMKARTIIPIRYWVSSSIMILRTRDETCLHHGSAESVLYHGSMDDLANPLWYIKHHNDFYTGKCGEVPTSWKCLKGPTPWKRGEGPMPWKHG